MWASTASKTTDRRKAFTGSVVGDVDFEGVREGFPDHARCPRGRRPDDHAMLMPTTPSAPRKCGTGWCSSLEQESVTPSFLAGSSNFLAASAGTSTLVERCP